VHSRHFTYHMAYGHAITVESNTRYKTKRKLILLILKTCSLPLFNTSLIRRLSLRRNPRQMPARAIIPVEQRTVRRDAVIPNHHRTRRPFDARLEVLTLCDVIVQEVEQKVRLLLLEAHDAPAKLRVHEERFLAGRRMRSHERVD
jgi:hypothetical protein